MSTQSNSKTRQKGRWRRGVSGNPRGRPKGARNRTTMAAMALLEGEAEVLTRSAIETALSGNVAALRIVMDRLIPPRRRPIVQIDLEELQDFPDAAQALRRVVQAALDGGLSLDDAERLSKLIIEHMRAHDIGEQEWRARRYCNALLRRCGELHHRLMKLHETIANGNIATEKPVEDSRLRESAEQIMNERPKLPEDSTGTALYVAALAWRYDCKKHEFDIERAWFELPPSERETLREAQKYFPFVELPED